MKLEKIWANMVEGFAQTPLGAFGPVTNDWMMYSQPKPDMSDQAILLRASMAPAMTPDALLRPAQGPDGTPPEQLLRPGSMPAWTDKLVQETGAGKTLGK